MELNKSDLEKVLSEIILSPELIPDNLDEENGIELYLDLDSKMFSTQKTNSNLFIGFYFVYNKETLIEDLKLELERESMERKMRENGLI